jgi:hypothetical protein
LAPRLSPAARKGGAQDGSDSLVIAASPASLTPLAGIPTVRPLQKGHPRPAGQAIISIGFIYRLSHATGFADVGPSQRRPSANGPELRLVFRNGLALSSIDVLWQEFAIGWLIIIAVSLDQWIRRVSA